MSDRADRLLPAGIPRYVRCYDNGGKTADNYTLVFTGNYAGREGRCSYISCNGNPTHPTYGFWQHGESQRVIDQPTYAHLGKRIKFSELPEIVQQLFISEYKEIWSLT